MERHYFDWAASSPPIFSVREKLDISVFGNPSSKHSEGRAARAVLDKAREKCAGVLNVPPDNLYWTSGGTESNAIALFSMLPRPESAKKRILVSNVEHPSVAENCAILKKFGFTAGSINVSQNGAVDEQSMEKALQKYPDTAFAAVMFVNNETGAISDIPALARKIRDCTGERIHIHSDMVQALGKIPIDLSNCDVDSASFSAHKLGGPRGIGLLYLKKPAASFCRGGGQEGGVRSGTENTEGAFLFAECVEKYVCDLQNNYEAAQKRMSYLIRAFKQLERCSVIPFCRDEDRGDKYKNFSPYIVQLAFKNIPGEVMARLLDDAGFAVSTGSACSSNKKERPVLDAMGIDKKTSFEAVRISQGWSTTLEEIDLLIDTVKSILKLY
ncbi:aminotransferase V [Spirochaetia bacterium]|nr:aminotransferase V [Spirochaetia bacterium]